VSDILCLDTEPETIKALKGAGHDVDSAPFGYRAKEMRYLHVAPQDFDLILCDLRTPACYDQNKWGPYGGNDNYKCTVVPPEELSWEPRLIRYGVSTPVIEQYRYHLISETQIVHMNPSSPFGPDDVRRAIALGGVPVVIFLNPEWMLRAGGDFPAFVGLQWQVGKANTSRIAVLDPLESLVLGWQPQLEITLPVRCMLRSGPTVPLRVEQKLYLEARPIVVDKVASVLGQVVRCGKGIVWMMPATTNNAEAACQFAADTDALSQTDALANAPITPSLTLPPARWDIFISHASEDQSFTNELHADLNANGVKVWYDEFNLTMGDSLRGKIDEGLAGSRYGVVVLSHDFLNKNWPKTELDALVSLQMADGKKRILPIWHNIDQSGVAQYSPLLATLLASKSEYGIGRNVKDILKAIDWPHGRVGDS
jgi:hypothetical protein